MSIAEYSALGAHEEVYRPINTDEYAGHNRFSASDQEKWQQVLDKLIGWGKEHPFDDEEIDPPTREAISLAYRFAAQLRESRMPAPVRVMPAADGGVVFETSDKNVLLSLRFDNDLSIDFCVFSDGKLIHRLTFPSSTRA